MKNSLKNEKIKHIWFDFSYTLASVNEEAHNRLRYESYAKVADKPITPELVDEYEKLYKKYKHSNSSVFESLGKLPGFWSKIIDTVNPRTLYYLTDENIPEILEQMSKILPVSIFSNIDLDKTLPSLGIKPEWFTHILSASKLGSLKPALDGFYKVIELSNLRPEEILYIGDEVEKDIIPAKTVGIKTGVVFEKLKEADYSFKDFRDILEFVKSRNI